MGFLLALAFLGGPLFFSYYAWHGYVYLKVQTLIYLSAAFSLLLAFIRSPRLAFPGAIPLLLYLLALLCASMPSPGKEAISRFLLAALGPAAAATLVWSRRAGLPFPFLQSLFLSTGLLQALLALYQAFAFPTPRVQGTLGNANSLSQFLLPPLLLAASLPGEGGFFATLIAGLALYLTGTRAGWAAALLGGAHLGSGALGRLLLSFVPGLLWPSGRSRLLAGGGSLRARLDLWREAWRLFLRHPLGIGLGRFPRLSSRHVGAHQTYLQLLAELGLPGFALALSPWAALAWRLRRLPQEEARPFQAILLASGFHALFNSTLQDPRASLTLWAALGLATLLSCREPPRTWRDT